jgi:hypothetical protein
MGEEVKMVIQTEIAMTNERVRNWPQIYLAFLMGMPFPTAAGESPQSVGTLGLVAKRGRERARLGQFDIFRDLHRTPRDPADRGNDVPLRAGAGSLELRAHQPLNA